MRENMLSANNDPNGLAMKSWLAHVSLLQARLQKTPAAEIPEFQYLTEWDWLDAARGDLNTDDDYRRALSGLRTAAENTFVATALRPALSQYAQANNGQFPTDISQLQPYFNPPVEASILQRWQVAPHSSLPDGNGITQIAAVDENYDARITVGLDGVSNNTSDKWWDTSVWDTTGPNITEILKPALVAYMAATNSQTPPADPSQLAPYATPPEQQAILQKIIQKSAGLGSN
jgi:hypothetical protein